MLLATPPRLRTPPLRTSPNRIAVPSPPSPFSSAVSPPLLQLIRAHQYSRHLPRLRPHILSDVDPVVVDVLELAEGLEDVEVVVAVVVDLGAAVVEEVVDYC